MVGYLGISEPTTVRCSNISGTWLFIVEMDFGESTENTELDYYGLYHRTAKIYLKANIDSLQRALMLPVFWNAKSMEVENSSELLQGFLFLNGWLMVSVCGFVSSESLMKGHYFLRNLPR